MATLVSTGQITIVDQNDAAPIQAYLTNGSQSLQQTYSKDNGVDKFIPSRVTTNLVLTFKANTAGVDISTKVTNPKWSYDASTALTTDAGTGIAITAPVTGSTSPAFTISKDGLLTSSTPSKVIYFECDYTDPTTGLISHILVQTQISLVVTGSNASFVQFKGINVIESSTGTTGKAIELVCDLIRSSGIDTDNLIYRWYGLFSGSWAALDQTYSGWSTKIGNRTATQAETDNLLAPTGIGSGVPATIAGATSDQCKGLVINETLVTDVLYLKCEVTDTADTASGGSSTTYIGYLTIYDKSDPYQLNLLSSSGDKLQNGVGSTDVYPQVFYGGMKLSPLTSWLFNWYFMCPTGNKGAFVDSSRTVTTGGRSITANTSGSSSVVTYNGSAITAAAGDIVKIDARCNAKGIRYYEIAASSGNTVTLKAPSSATNTFLNNSDNTASIVSSDFINAKFFICTANGVRSTSGGSTDLSAKITITGDDIDVKGNVCCDGYKPL